MISTRSFRRLMTTLIKASPGLIALSVCCARPAHAQRPLEPMATHRTLSSVVDLIDIRDTSAKDAFALLLQAGNVQFALRDDIDGSARFKASGRTIDECLGALRTTNSQALMSSVENGVYFLRPLVAKLGSYVSVPRSTARRPLANPRLAVHAPASPALVRRHVTGIVILHDGPSYALLETDVNSEAGPDIRIVSWNPGDTKAEPSLVPSGVATMSELTVAKIDASGVTLAADDGSRIHVALASAAYGAH